MKKILFYILLILSGGLVSCSKSAEEAAPASRTLSFTASIGPFGTKATDWFFEEGDRIGLIERSYQSLGNIGLTVLGKELVPDSPVEVEGQPGKPEFFFAYYPYMPDYQDRIIFTVNSDQSTHELYTASDLMKGFGSAPIEEDMHVNLEFYHILSNLVIIPECYESISELYVADVLGICAGYISSDEYSTAGDPGIIKAGKVSYGDSEAWAVIIPPQICKPRLLIITESGAQFEYELPRQIYLNRAQRTVANVRIDKGSTTADITDEILTDWTDDKDLSFLPKGGTYSSWLGTWTAHDADLWGDVYDYNIVIRELDPSNSSYQVSGLCPYLSAVVPTPPQDAVAYASDDFMTLTIPSGQSTGYSSGGKTIAYSSYPFGTDIVIEWNSGKPIFATPFGVGKGGNDPSDWYDYHIDGLTLFRIL